MCTSLRHISILFIFWIGNLYSIYSQNFVFNAQKINVEDGLPHRSVYDVTQDSDGYIWISVPGSISRYDGSNFKSYNSSFLKTGDNLAYLIASDKNNNLWYCERSELDKPIFSGVIDTKKDSVYHFENFSKGLFNSQDVIRISQSKKQPSTIFITTRNGVIYKYTDHFEEIYRFPYTLKNNTICDETNDTGYWILYRSHVLKIKDNKITSTYSIPDLYGKMYRIVTQEPNLIVEARDNLEKKTYWELKNDTLIPYNSVNISKNLHQLFQKTTDYICYSSNDTIYINDNFGKSLFQFNDIDNSGASFKYQTTLVDRQNILWIASGNGLYKIIPKKNPFKLLQENQSIRGIFKDTDQLYVGSYTENVSVNLKTLAKTTFIKVPNVAATSFIKDKDAHLWAGTTTQLLFEFIPKSNIWNYYRLEERISLLTPLINSETEKLWLGTSDGLAFMNSNTKQIEFIKLPIPDRNTEIRNLYQNKKGVWAISNKGVFLMEAQTETILKHYNQEDGLPNDNLNHMHEDSDGTFWLASKEAGLIHWNLETNAFKQYTIQNGLSNNNIYAVYSDDYNNLWLTSNYGLMRFNKETENVRVYLPKNGIAHEEFNTFAHFKDKDGTLYFGGLNGITVFHPKDLREEIVTEVPLRLIQIQVLNQQDSGFIDITKSFQTTNGIILEPTDRIIEIEVSLLDFENPTEIQYMYQIKGYQDQWLYTKSNRITFNNLPYGSYTINIKGKGLASGNSSNMLEIPVIVEKPFYLTWQFITIMILLLTLLIFGVVKWRISRLQKDRERLEKEVQVRTKRIENDKDIIEAQAESLKDLDKAKSHFFSNITHEFRTPLTLIIGPLEQLLDEQPPPTVFKRRMKGILKNANHILGLINQLLDISKIESGQMKLEIVHGDIIQYTDDIVKRFESLASQKKQRLAFIANRESWYVQFDQSKWDKIILNLLSNALKFTSKEGSIQVSLFSIIVNEKPYIKVCVSDLGIGINATDIDQIFNRFYQVDSSLRRMEEGTGIGLSLVKELVTFQGGEVKVFSVENQGTTFEIQLPVLEDQLELRSLDISNKDQPEVPIVDARINSSKLNSLVSENEALEILIVEDNIEMREYIRQCLKKPSYNITEAANGSEGLQKAQTIIPDLIISDVMMPKMDGYELTQSIRENISTSHIPLILLTAKSSLDSKLKGLKRGADAYLTKPFSPLELQINVQNLIEIRSSLQKRYGDKEISAANEIYEQEDEFITKLKNYILDNITEPNLNGDHIGRQFGLSRVHLYRKLKALTGYSITDFVKKIRLERALYLLKEGNLNVSEVADITGFSNISHFSSSFKKAYGKAPSQL